MNRRFVFLAGLAGSLVLSGCTVAEGTASQDESDLATESSYIACTPAAATSDGKNLVYATCPSAYNGGSVVLQAVGGGRRTLKSFNTTDTIFATGTSGTMAWWAYETPGLSPQIRIQNTVGVAPPVEANLPIVPQQIGDVRVLADGTVVIIATGKDWRQYLITGRANTTPLVAHVISTSEYDSFDLCGSSDTGSELYLVERINAGGVGSWRRFNHQGTGAPSIGPFIYPEKSVASPTVKGDFLGGLFWAEVRTGANTFGIGVVTMATGRVQILADGFTSFSSFVTSGQFAWFAARKPDGTWELDRLSMRPDLSPAQTLLTDGGILWAYLSADATTLVFRGGPHYGANTLGTVAADGTSPPSYIIRASENKTIDFVNPQPEAGRYLIAIHGPLSVGGRSTLRLIDGTTAQKLGEWTQGGDFELPSSTQLSANGQALFGSRKCNATTASSGTQWVELWPAYTAVSGCEQGFDTLSSRTLEAIPNSNAVMINANRGGAGVVRVFRP